MNWDRLIVALVLVRLGQELGTSGPVAQAVASLIDAVLRLAQLPAAVHN